MRTIPTSLIDKQYVCVNYVVFENAKGEEEFFYIAVRGHRMPEFKRALREGGFYPDDYGYIIEQGKGEASDLLKEKMALQYRCNHKQAIRLVNKRNREKAKKEKANKDAPLR